MKLVALRASFVVAAVYGYFLIYAQFAFVELLRAGGVGLTGERVALGMMAVGGVLGGFFAAWNGSSPRQIRLALAAAALSSAFAPAMGGLPGSIGIALMTGVSLGIATVSISAILPAWCCVGWIGLGTGLAYSICNFPLIFKQPPVTQAWIGSAFAVMGLLGVPSDRNWSGDSDLKVFPFWGVVAMFTSLVWLDSAAFFIIQHSAVLKSVTWGSELLWRNSIIHLTAAVISGIWLERGGAKKLPGAAWVILAVAAVAVSGESTRALAGWIYPVGVSLYSTALVAWPGWYSGARGIRQAGWRAAALFAIAGWFGSANGIGMAGTLHEIPRVFITVSGLTFLAVFIFSDLRNLRCAVVVGGVMALGFGMGELKPLVSESPFERGRQVYLSEGCIHCHSQYIRPGTYDEEVWGPVRDVSDVLGGRPVLIGNRRQGPDLTHVGARRSQTWLKLHFIQPSAFSPGTVMPSYAKLFESSKGDDLVRFLAESGNKEMSKVAERANRWYPGPSLVSVDGRSLFLSQCALCHSEDGKGDGPQSLLMARKPANLVEGPFAWTPAGENLDLRVARVIKFGLPGTDMPGHEVLTDSEILALKNEVLKLRSGQ